MTPTHHPKKETVISQIIKTISLATLTTLLGYGAYELNKVQDKVLTVLVFSLIAYLHISLSVIIGVALAFTLYTTFLSYQRLMITQDLMYKLSEEKEQVLKDTVSILNDAYETVKGVANGSLQSF